MIREGDIWVVSFLQAKERVGCSRQRKQQRKGQKWEKAEPQAEEQRKLELQLRKWAVAGQHWSCVLCPGAELGVPQGFGVRGRVAVAMVWMRGCRPPPGRKSEGL